MSVLKMVRKQMPIFSYYNSYTKFLQVFVCYGFYPVCVITISQWTQTAMVYHRLCMGYQIMHYLKISCTVKCKITHMLGEHYLLYVITDYSFSQYRKISITSTYLFSKLAEHKGTYFWGDTYFWRGT